MEPADSFRYNVRQDEIPTETRLQSDIAALQYKNERLVVELRDCESRVKLKEQSLLTQASEIDGLKENLARLNVINSSLRRRVQEGEEKERNFTATNQRSEFELSKFRHENSIFEEKIRDLETQLRTLLIDREVSDQAKETAQRLSLEFCRKLAASIDFSDDYTKTENILKRVYEIFQDNGRLKLKLESLRQTIESIENEARISSDTISRLNSDKESNNRQIVSYLTTADALKRERDEFQTEKCYLQTDLHGCKERLAIADRAVLSLNDQLKTLEVQLQTQKENTRIAEDRWNRYEKELKQFQESVAIQLSTGSRLVDSTPIGIRERIKDTMVEIKEKQLTNDQLREKVGRLTENLERLEKLLSDSKTTQEDAISEKVILSKRLDETEAQLTTIEVLNEGLRRDKNRYMQFLEKLGNTFGLDEVSKELGFDLQTDAILSRAEQLSKLEGDRLADKTATVYQLQRRLRTLKEQLEKKDLHLDMLRKKISLLEDSIKIRTSLELERDEAYTRTRKLMKQIERNELELKETRFLTKELKAQLTDAAQYKIVALERARKIDELETRVNDLELLRIKYNRKVNILKDQVKISRENTNQERDLNDNAFRKLSSELNQCRRNLMEAARRENQLLNLRNTIGKILGFDWAKISVPDYELLGKLEKVVQTNREFAQVSRKLSDSIKQIPCQDLDSPRDMESV